MSKKNLGWIAVSLVLFLCLSTGASTPAESTWEKILKLKEEIIKIRNEEGELGFRNFTLCSQIITVGTYIPLPERKIKKGGELRIYYEPANIFVIERAGRYEFWLTQDIFVFDKKGKAVMEQEELVNVHLSTQDPYVDLFVQIALTLAETPVGKYIYKAVLHDKFRGTTATKTIDFEIVD